ncbi:glycosyltransferase family 4 protein [Planctomycetota bacterium]
MFNSEAQGVIGGSEIDLYYLATELAQDQVFEVSFVVADYGQAEDEIHEGVRVLRSLDFTKNALSGGCRIWGALGRADAQVYLMKTFSPGTPLVRWFCRRRGRVFIYRTAHRYDCDGTYMRRRRFWGRAFAWSLHGAQEVLAQNETDAELLAETLGVSARVIPNGHRLPSMVQKKRDIILWVGRTTDFKRPELFMELARQHPTENFCMICQQATEDKEYRQTVEKAQGVENLEFIRYVPFHQVEEYFQRARLLVNTSDAEGFPNTFIQACKCEAPILSLNVNPDGFLDKQRCGVCAGGDWEVFGRELRRMLESDRAAEYGANGRRYVEENHDIKKIIEQYKSIFRELAG